MGQDTKTRQRLLSSTTEYLSWARGTIFSVFCGPSLFANNTPPILFHLLQLVDVPESDILPHEIALSTAIGNGAVAETLGAALTRSTTTFTVLTPPPFEVGTTTQAGHSTTAPTTTATTTRPRPHRVSVVATGWLSNTVQTLQQRHVMISSFLTILGLDSSVDVADVQVDIDEAASTVQFSFELKSKPSEEELSAMRGALLPATVTTDGGGTVLLTLTTAQASASAVESTSASDDGGSNDLPLYAGIGGALLFVALVVGALVYRFSPSDNAQQPLATHRRTLEVSHKSPQMQRKFEAVRDPEQRQGRKPNPGSGPGAGPRAMAANQPPKKTGSRLDMTGLSMLLKHGILPDMLPQMPVCNDAASSDGDVSSDAHDPSDPSKRCTRKVSLSADFAIQCPHPMSSLSTCLPCCFSHVLH